MSERYDSLQPSEEWMYRFVKGRITEPAPRQYANWAAEYLDRPERFGFNDYRMLIGYLILNDACVKYLGLWSKGENK